eukprot:858736_1
MGRQINYADKRGRQNFVFMDEHTSSIPQIKALGWQPMLSYVGYIVLYLSTVFIVEAIRKAPWRLDYNLWFQAIDPCCFQVDGTNISKTLCIVDLGGQRTSDDSRNDWLAIPVVIGSQDHINSRANLSSISSIDPHCDRWNTIGCLNMASTSDFDGWNQHILRIVLVIAVDASFPWERG